MTPAALSVVDFSHMVIATTDSLRDFFDPSLPPDLIEEIPGLLHEIGSTTTSLQDRIPPWQNSLNLHDSWMAVAPEWMPSESRTSFLHCNKHTVRLTISSSGAWTDTQIYDLTDEAFEEQRVEALWGTPRLSTETIHGHTIAADRLGNMWMYRSLGGGWDVLRNPVVDHPDVPDRSAAWTFTCPISGVVGRVGHAGAMRLWRQG